MYPKPLVAASISAATSADHAFPSEIFKLVNTIGREEGIHTVLKTCHFDAPQVFETSISVWLVIVTPVYAFITHGTKADTKMINRTAPTALLCL